MRPGELLERANNERPSSLSLPFYLLSFDGGSQGSAGLRQESPCLHAARRPPRDIVPKCIVVMGAQETWIQGTVTWSLGHVEKKRLSSVISFGLILGCVHVLCP